MSLINLDWGFTYLIAQSSSSSSGVEGLFNLIIWLTIYVFTSYCFYAIYQKLGEANAWFAWVPILQHWAMLKAGD